MRALVKASLQSILKSPSAVVFSILFPLVFIVVFGLFGNNQLLSMSLVVETGTDTTSELYHSLDKNEIIKLVHLVDTAEVSKRMKNGDLMGTILLKQTTNEEQHYDILLNISSSQVAKLQQLESLIQEAVQKLDPEIQAKIDAMADVKVEVATVREFKSIDFILPGQLGFSLLAGSVFGTAFVFFNLRQTLVLKRFFATPVRREIIVLSEGIARMIFQLMGAVVIITIGYFAFGYTLVNGIVTFLEMILISAMAILVFMGFGFIISGITKSETTIPPLSNLITLPQFLLAGTFFPIDVFPSWLQPICRALPLTYLNSALRKIAFDGASLWDVRIELLILLGWGAVLYIIAGRVFRWE
ncbi:MAG: ABC transporter permease [Flavipsychrobacter sp.]